MLKEQYKPNFLQFVPTVTLPLYVSGLFSGIILDFGFSQTEILAVVEGIPLKGTIDFAPIGGLRIALDVLKAYKESGVVSNTLLDSFESDFDVLASICVGIFHRDKYLQSITDEGCPAPAD